MASNRAVRACIVNFRSISSYSTASGRPGLLYFSFPVAVPVAPHICRSSFFQLALVLTSAAPVVGGHAVTGRVIISSEICSGILFIIFFIGVVVISLRNVIPPVRLVIHNSVTSWPAVELMPWSKAVEPVVRVDISRISRIAVIGVILQEHIPDPVDHSVMVISNLDTTGSNNPSEVIVIDRHALDLDHCTVIIILHKRIVIITAIKAERRVTAKAGNNTARIKIEVELPVRKKSEFHPAFSKNKGIAVTKRVTIVYCRTWGSFSRKTNH